MSRPDPARGVFETLLVWGGRPLELDAHLARLGSSLSTLFRRPPPSGISALALDRSRGVELGRLRATVSPDHDGVLAPRVRVQEVDPGDVFPSWNRAVDLARVVVPGGVGAHKWADRSFLETAEAASRPALPLLLDADGTVLEASRGNVFVVEGGALVTPRADGRILPGVTRGRVVEIAKERGIPSREDVVSLERLLQADEVFLTGAVRGVEPVRGCDGLKEWRAGQVTSTLSRALRRLWASQAPAPARLGT